MSVPATFALALSNETATAHLMADLALLIGPGDVITLSGDLGAGKTAAARAVEPNAGRWLSAMSMRSCGSADGARSGHSINATVASGNGDRPISSSSMASLTR